MRPPLLAVGVLATVLPAAADVETLTRDVTLLVEQGHSQQALERIEAARPACGADRRCRLAIDYSTGYALQHAGFLERAAAAYEAVLRVEPRHAPTIANLVEIYGRLGLNEKRRRVLEMGSRLDGRAGAGFALALGDLLQERRDWHGALVAYHRAAHATPDDAAPPHRIVALHRRMPVHEIPQSFVDTLAGWEAPFPNAAADGYEIVIQAAGESRPALAERALLGWVRVLARADTLAPAQARTAVLDLVARTGLDRGGPATLRSAVEQLADMLDRAPSGSWPNAGYWYDTSDRGETLARLCLPVGRALLLDGNHKAGEACWRNARNRSVRLERTWLELTTNLATLYTMYPDEFPQAFRGLEEELFSAKSEAYRTGDLPTIQRFHTVLALIYSGRGQWVSDDPYRNALFQASRAIHTADKRGDVAYEPLPSLKQLRADGLAAVAADARMRGTFSRNPRGFLDEPDLARPPDLEQAAGQAYLEATRAHLDADALDGAARMLESARRHGATDDEGAAALDDLIRRRQEIRRPPPAPGAAPSCTAAAPKPPPRGVPASFWDRQQFKSLSDCVAAGRSTDPELDSARALLLVTDGKVPLAGAADHRRILLTQDHVAAATGVKLDRRPSLRADPAAVVGARVLSELGPGKRPVIQVRGNEVVVEQSETVPEAERQAMKERIAKLPSVHKVTTKTKPKPP